MATAKTKSAEPRLKTKTLNMSEAIAAMWEGNPRVITESELNNLRMSLKEFGLVIPPIFNEKTGRIVGGHQRIRAAQLEGYTEIPVTVVSLAEPEEIALNLALNKIEGKWDYGLLEKIVSELSESDAINYTGFSETDLIALLSDTSDLDQINDFESFVERNQDVAANPLIFFRCPHVSFSCLREDYDAFISRLYEKYGYDDFLIEKQFFNLLGL